MGDLTYTNSMMNEIRVIIKRTSACGSADKYRAIVYLLEWWEDYC